MSAVAECRRQASPVPGDDDLSTGRKGISAGVIPTHSPHRHLPVAAGSAKGLFWAEGLPEPGRAAARRGPAAGVV